MKDLETLLNVRENISLNLLDGVKNRKSDFRTFTLCTTGNIHLEEQLFCEVMIL